MVNAITSRYGFGRSTRCTTSPPGRHHRAAILGGHILGIVAAHGRSLVLLHGPNQTPRSTALGQLQMLLVMVFFTCAGLLLLFSP